MTETYPPAVAARFVALSLDDLIPSCRELAARYKAEWAIGCAVADLAGRVVAGNLSCREDCQHPETCSEACKLATAESVRWGEPSVSLCAEQSVVWAVPVMLNRLVIGGLVAAKPSPRAGSSLLGLRQAIGALLNLAVDANLTNSAFLESQRLLAKREAERAQAIHELKSHDYRSIREIYLVEEPTLIAAVKAVDRRAAREILNRVLLAIYFEGRDRPSLLKSLLLELVVTVSRSAVEAGADPTELLGANYSAFSDLARIESEEELCSWLIALLERAMDAIAANHRYPIGALLASAMKHMQEHLGEDLTRDEVARIACLSPSHFSRVIRQTSGYSFTELLTRMRVEKARELLVRTEKSLLQVGLECGFTDQSHFTRVFQKSVGRPPGEYRRYRRAVL